MQAGYLKFCKLLLDNALSAQVKILLEQQAICFCSFLFRCICCRSGAASATTGQQTRQSECRLRSLKFIFIRYRKNQALFHLAPCRQVLAIPQNYVLATQAKQMLVKLFLTACCKCLCPILTKCSTANIFFCTKKDFRRSLLGNGIIIALYLQFLCNECKHIRWFPFRLFPPLLF